MGPRNRIQSRRIRCRSDSHWTRVRMGAPPGPTSRGGRSGASAGSLEGGVCTSSSHGTSRVPARLGFDAQASPASTAGAAATNRRRETPAGTDPPRLANSKTLIVESPDHFPPCAGAADDHHPGARASRPHKAWHSGAHLAHFDKPGTAPFPNCCVAEEPFL